MTEEAGDLPVNELLISLVRERRPLWDMTSKLYHDKNVKCNMWAEIARLMNVGDDFPRKRWKSIRDRYTKSLKEKVTKSGQAAQAKNQWALASQLEFLRDTVKPRTSTESCSLSVTESSDESNTVMPSESSTEPAPLMYRTVLQFENADVQFEDVTMDLDATVLTPVTSPYPIPSTSTTSSVPALGSANPLPKFKRPIAAPSTMVSRSPSPTTSLSPSLTPVHSPHPTSPADLYEQSSHSSGGIAGKRPGTPLSDRCSSKKGKKEDNLDHTFHQYLLGKTEDREQKRAQKQHQLSSDEHYFLSVAKEAEKLSQIQRMRLRHFIDGKMIELFEEKLAKE